jgi:hypothetical protein
MRADRQFRRLLTSYGVLLLGPVPTFVVPALSWLVLLGRFGDPETVETRWPTGSRSSPPEDWPAHSPTAVSTMSITSATSASTCSLSA